MLLENINDSFFLKSNDTATQIHLRVLDSEEKPFPLENAKKIEVVIGVEAGRVLTLTPKLLSGVGELEFGLDEGDLIPVGKNRLEVHVYTQEGEKHVAPSKGYYMLNIQKPIDELGVEVTTYTLDYFLSQVDKSVAGVQDMIDDGNKVIQEVKTSAEGIEAIKNDATAALNDANNANDAAVVALAKSNEALTVSEQTLSKANAAVDNATNAATLANNAASGATDAANEAKVATVSANSAAAHALSAAEGAKGWGLTVAWNSLTQFYPKNTVTHKGSMWQARIANIGSEPSSSNLNWIEIVFKGEKGADGTGITIIGELNDPSELPATGNSGDAYMINAELWVWNGKEFTNVGSIKGDKGDDGKDGISAYQVAVNNGFVGTEQEWLASLKGADGDPATNIIKSVNSKVGDVVLTSEDVGAASSTELDSLRTEVTSNALVVENHTKAIASTDVLGHVKSDGKTFIVDPVTGVASAVLEGGAGLKAKEYTGDLNNLIEPGIYSVPANTPNAPNTYPVLVEVLASTDGKFVIQRATYSDIGTSVIPAFTRRALKDPTGTFVWSTPSAGAVGFVGTWRVVDFILNDSITTSSTNNAATANAVKQVNDKFSTLEQDVKLTLSNGWQGIARTFKQPNGIVNVHIDAYGGNAADGTIIATLPVGYRPTYTMVDFAGMTYNATNPPSQTPIRIVVEAGGAIKFREESKYSIVANFNLRNT